MRAVLKEIDNKKYYTTCKKMASTIVGSIQNKNRCTPADLFIKGFTSAEVVQCWHLAHSIASFELKLLDNLAVFGSAQYSGEVCI